MILSLKGKVSSPMTLAFLCSEVYFDLKQNLNIENQCLDSLQSLGICVVTTSFVFFRFLICLVFKNVLEHVPLSTANTLPIRLMANQFLKCP